MKKILTLAASLLLLTACSPDQSPDKGSSTNSSQGINLETEYDKIVSQYEEAAKASTFKAADYPLVNPVSFDMAKGYSGEGPLDIESDTEDLDGDGQEELLIGTDTPAENSEEITIYVAIYGLIDGEITDLTKDILLENADNFLTVYENNRVRLDRATQDGKSVNAVYELTSTGYNELIYIEFDPNQSSDIEEIKISDRDGKLYRKNEVESKLEEIIGHPLMEGILD